MSDNQIFREKSLERINSPEALDKYIKAANPSVWVLLAAIIVFLAGVIIWGTFGTIDSKASVGCALVNGNTICAIKEEQISKITQESKVVIDDKEYDITKTEGPFEANGELLSETILHLSDIDSGEWYYTITLKGSADTNKATIIFERLSPISLIIN